MRQTWSQKHWNPKYLSSNYSNTNIAPLPCHDSLTWLRFQGSENYASHHEPHPPTGSVEAGTKNKGGTAAGCCTKEGTGLGPCPLDFPKLDRWHRHAETGPEGVSVPWGRERGREMSLWSSWTYTAGSQAYIFVFVFTFIPKSGNETLIHYYYYIHSL